MSDVFLPIGHCLFLIFKFGHGLEKTGVYKDSGGVMVALTDSAAYPNREHYKLILKLN